MTHAEIMAHEFANRFFKYHDKRIKSWIIEQLENNSNEPAEFTDWYSKFIADDEVSKLTVERLVEDQLAFLNTTIISDCLQKLFDSLQDEIIAEMEDQNDSDEHIKADYYRSVL